MMRILAFFSLCLPLLLTYDFSFSQTAVSAGARHVTLDQQEVTAFHSPGLSGSTSIGQWTVFINGSSAGITVTGVSGTSETSGFGATATTNLTFVAIKFDASGAAGHTAATPYLLPGETLSISFNNIGSTLKTVTSGNVVANYGPVTSANTYTPSATGSADILYQSEGIASTLDQCSPVNTNFFRWTYLYSLRYRNSTKWTTANNQLHIVWGSGASTSDLSGYLSNSGGDPSTSQSPVNIFTGGNPGVYVSFRSGLNIASAAAGIINVDGTNQFIYPDNTGVCNFRTTQYPIGVTTAVYSASGSPSLEKNTQFNSYDYDDQNTGTLSMTASVPPVTATSEFVCLGSNVGVQFTDASTFNCVGNGTVLPTPSQGAATTPINNQQRWVRLIYGGANSTVAANVIPNIYVGGVQVTDATGALLPAWSVNPILPGSYTDNTPNPAPMDKGYVYTGGGADANGVITLAANATASSVVSELITTSSATGQAVGQRFYVTLQYWGVCNPYPTSAPVEISLDYVEIIDRPNPPTVLPTGPFCETAASSSFNFTATGTGSGTLTYTWYKDSGLTNTLQAASTDNTFNPVTEGTALDRINQTVTGSTTFHRYVTVTQGGNGCTSLPTDISIQIDDTNVPGTISHPLGATPIVICSGTDPAAFVNASSGTAGGTSSSYQWQSSPNNSVWTDIAGATSATYDPPAISSRTYFRRKFISGSCADVFSNVIEFRVDTPVTPGSISGNQTICESPGDPSNLASTGGASGGNNAGTHSYQWQLSTTSSTGPFTDIVGATSTSFNPGAGVIQTTYYRRKVTSGVCSSDANLDGIPDNVAFTSAVTVTVNNLVNAGTIANAQVICAGQDPAALTASVATGGDGSSYTYLWQQSTVSNTGPFSNASGINNTQTYDPPVLTQTTWYRRTSSSGVCSSVNSNVIEITVNPLPTATVAGGGSVCSGTPAPDIVWTLTGSPPFNFTITRSVEGPLVVAGHNSLTYTIASPNPPASQTYEITSLTDNNGCTATSMGGQATVNIQAVPPPSVQSFSSTGAVCDDGGSTNPPDGLLDLLPDAVATYNIGYKLKNLNTLAETIIPAANFVSDASGVITISPTYAQMGNAPEAAGYQIIITSIFNTATLCAGAVPINGPTLIVNSRPATPTGAVNSTACSAGGGSLMSVTDPGAGFDIAWSTAGPSLASYVAVNAGDGTVSGTRNVSFTPSTSGTQTFYAFTRNTTTSCLSATGLAVTQTQDVIPAAASAGANQPNACGLTSGSPVITMAATSATNGGIGAWSIPGKIAYYQNFENFAIGTQTSTASNGWTRDVRAANAFTNQGGTGYFEVKAGKRFEASNTNGNLGSGAANIGELVWTSSVFDISAVSGFPAVSAFVDVTNVSNDLDAGADADYVKVFYKLNGGAEIAFTTNGNLTGNFASATASVSGLVGNTLQIVIRVSTNDVTERVAFDNIIVKDPTSTVTIANPNSPTTTVSNLPAPAPGGTAQTTSLLWTVASALGSCSNSSSTVSVTINPLPTAVDPLPALCEDIAGGGSHANVDLTTYNSSVTNLVAVPGTTVQWFSNAARTIAVVGNVTVVNGSIFYFTSTSPAPFNCVNTGQITFTVNPLPTAITRTYSYCEDNPPGSLIASGIDLTSTSIKSDIIGADPPGSRTITWHNTMAGANANNDLVVAPASYSITATTSVFARVLNTVTGCVNISQVNLNYQPRAGNNRIKDALGNFLTPVAPPLSGTISVCAANSLILYQIDPSINPGASYNWNVPASSYTVPANTFGPGNPSVATPEFELLSPTNNFFVILRFNYSTNNPPSGFTSLYATGIPITVTETLGTGCSGNQIALDVDVEASPPKPIISGPSEVCANGSGNTYSVTNPVLGTYSWTFPPGVSITSLPVTNSSVQVQWGIANGNVQVTHSSGTGCISPAADPYPVIAYARPEMTDASIIICNNTMVSTAHTFSSTFPVPPPTTPVGIVTYNWQVTNVVGFVGGTSLGNSGTGNINEILTNTSGTVASVIYTVTPIGPGGTACVGTPKTLTVTVNPEPVVSAVTDVDVCSGGTVSAINFAANTGAGTSFTWTNSNPLIGIPASGSGNISSFTAATNTTNADMVATIVVTGSQTLGVTTCSSAGANQETFTITIHPQPSFTNATPSGGCSSDLLLAGFDLNGTHVGTSINAATFDITTTPNGLIQSSGTVSAGTGKINTELADDVWQNTGSTPVNVIYTVTPVSASGCKGANFTVTLSVDPEPVYNGTSKTICSTTEAVGVNLSTLKMGAGVNASTYDITNISTGGLTPVSGAPVVATGRPATEIADDVWLNTGAASVNVVYTIVPVSASGCKGSPMTITITVNPEPIYNVANKTICSTNDATGIDLSLLKAGAGVSASSFNVISINNNGLTSVAGAPVTGNGKTALEISDDKWLNTTAAPVNVEYLIEPVTAASCKGAQFLVTIVVNPEPTYTGTASTICSTLDAVAVNLSTLKVGAGITATSFTIVSINNNGLVAVAGSPVTGSGKTATEISDDKWRNIGNANVDVIYTIVPVAGTCDGTAITITITIKPEPVFANATLSAGCSDDASLLSGFDLNGTHLGTSVSAATFDISINSNGLVQSAGTVSAGSGKLASELADDVWTNQTGATVNVVYTIIPKSAAGCDGDSFTVTVPVRPEPKFTNATPPGDCSDTAGQLSAVDLFSTHVGTSIAAATFNITVNSNGLTQSGGIPSAGLSKLNTELMDDKWENVTAAPVNVIYSVVPVSAAGCKGDVFFVTVPIQPEPKFSNVTHAGGCSDTPVLAGYDQNSSHIGSSIAATLFDISVNSNGLTQSAGTVSAGINKTNTEIADDQWTNPTVAIVNVVYTLTPISAGGCRGDSFTITVPISPEPQFTNATPSGGCSDDAVLSGFSLSSTFINTSVSASTFDISINSNGLTQSGGTISSGTGKLAAELADDRWHNEGLSVVNVIYTVTPVSATGCKGNDFTVTVPIQPEPKFTVATPPSGCSDTSVLSGFDLNGTYVATSVAASTFDITVNSNGLTQSGGTVSAGTGKLSTELADDVWRNEGLVPVSVIYTVVPVSAANCKGDSFTVTVSILPEPKFTDATPVGGCSDDSILSGFDLNSTYVNTSVAATTFEITTNANGLTQTGGTVSAGTGKLSNELADDAWHNDGALIVNVVYTVVPVSAGGCKGNSFTVTVPVKPEPVYNGSTITQCSQDALGLDLSTLKSGTGVNASTFTINSITPNGLTPGSGNAVIGSIAPTGIAGDTWTNKTSGQVDVVYNITPVSAGGCAGTPIVITVHVNPEPKATSNPVLLTVERCSGASVNYNLQNIINDAGGGGNTVPSVFRYTVTADFPNDLSPVVFPGVFDRTAASAANITETFSNRSGHDVTLTYTVTPISTPEGCVGSSFTFKVIYHSEPVGAAFAEPGCNSGVMLNHNLQTQITNGVTSIFSYTVSSNNPGVPAAAGRPMGSASAAFITDTYTNTTGSPASITYTITAISSAKGCVAQSTFDYVVNVDSKPVASAASITKTAKCSDESFSFDPQIDINTAPGNSVISTFTWTLVYDGGAPVAGSGNVSGNLHNESNVVKNAVFTVTPRAIGGTNCIGDDFAIVVPINPEPVMTSSLATPFVICSTNNVSSNPANVTLSTTAASATTSGYNIELTSIDPGLDGLGATPDIVGVVGTGLPANTLIGYTYRNTTSAQLSVKFKIIPVGVLGGCEGQPLTVTILVNPEPVLASPVYGPVCSHNAQNPSTIGVVLGTNGTSAPATTYSILQVLYSTGGPFGAAVPTGVTRFANPGAGSDLIKNDRYNNISSAAVTVRYVIQGRSAANCLSEPFNYDVIINPEPILVPGLVTQCSGVAVGPAITLGPSGTSVAISSYELKQVALTDPSLTAASTNKPLGIYSAADFLKDDIFFNTSSSSKDVIYTIAPITADGCKGIAQTVTLTVLPSPALASGLDAKVCNAQSSGIILKDNSITNPTAIAPFSETAAAFEIVSVTFDNTKLTIAGGAPGISAATTNFNILSDDQFTNLTDDPQTVTYGVVPVSALGCKGPQRSIILTVEPPIKVTATNFSPDICSGSAVNIDLSSVSNPTPVSAPPNPLITFNYTRASISGIAGVSGNNVAQGFDITDVIVNSTNNPVVVHYLITAVAASAADGSGCISAPVDVAVTVEPKPKLTPTRSSQTVCHGVAISGVTLNSATNPSPASGVVQFQLMSVVDPVTSLPPTQVTGYSAVNTIFAKGQSLNDALSNSSALPQVVRYIFRPQFSAGLACTVTPAEYVSIDITVTPLPFLTVAIPGPTTICNGDTFEATMTTNTDTANPGSTLVSWTATASSVDIVGESNGVGDQLFQTLINKGSQVQTVNYAITSSLNGCLGNSVPITVTVNPMPTVNPPAKRTVCGGVPFSLDLRSFSPTDPTLTTFRWTVTDVNNIGTPGQFDGTGTVISEVYANNSNAQATLIYQITPIFGGCEGIERVMNVSVGPTMDGGFISTDEDICEGTPVFLTFDMKGQAPLEFVYRATDANNVVTDRTITKSGNVKVEKVTPSTTTTYEIISIKDGLGCSKNILPAPKVKITVFKNITAGWTAAIPPFIGGNSKVTFTNTSTPVDATTFRYEWSFGSDNAPSPTTATGIGPHVVNYNRPGDHYVSLHAVNMAAEAKGLACEGTFAQRISIPILPLVAAYKFEPKAACYPHKITVTENTSTGDVMEWRVIDINGRVAATSNAATPVFEVSAPGKYTITLKTSNSFTGQIAFATNQDFEIYEKPSAAFQLRPTTVFVPDQNITTFNFSTGSTDYSWDFGDGGKSVEFEPTYIYKIEGVYDVTLIAQNDHGGGIVCSDTVVQKVTARQGGATKVPNAFTPSSIGSSGGAPGNGGSGQLNDVFLPIVKGVEEFNMQIFDRWGNLIFESNNSQIGWDGYDKNGKLLPAGVYVYKLTLRLSDGQRTTQVGDITMIR